MMDRWMPMQQMLMDHMMQHQYWMMMQRQSSRAPNRFRRCASVNDAVPRLTIAHDPEFARNRMSGELVISCDHHGSNASSCRDRDSFNRFRSRRIGNPQQAEQFEFCPLAAPDTSFGDGHDHCHFGWISDATALIDGEICVAARGRHIQDALVVRAPNFAYHHDASRERSRIRFAEPTVSTAINRRGYAWRSAIRRMPTASAIVTIAGNPSGTAATASDTADEQFETGQGTELTVD